MGGSGLTFLPLPSGIGAESQCHFQNKQNKKSHNS
jgi:hypothetical protein